MRTVLQWKSTILAAAFCLAMTAFAPAARAGAPLEVNGTELLPQYLHPEGAVFAYDLKSCGRKVGAGLVVVDHEAELPESCHDCVPVYGGSFAFKLGWLPVWGDVVGGEICGTYDPDVYEVYLMLRTWNGSYLCFEGQLDHRPLNASPPRLPVIHGVLSSCSSW